MNHPTANTCSLHGAQLRPEVCYECHHLYRPGARRIRLMPRDQVKFRIVHLPDRVILEDLQPCEKPNGARQPWRVS